MNSLSVVICAHNPRFEIFNQVLDSLISQDLPYTEWELVVIDNKSTSPISENFRFGWHPKARIVTEDMLGLSFARLRGVRESSGSLIVFVDDDNVLDPAFLRTALNFHLRHKEVGCFGGRSLPRFATHPPSWFFETGINLGCQDFGSKEYISDYKLDGFKVEAYPSFAPIGTGMVITKEAFLSYQSLAESDPERLALGRKGKALTSGEDNDIILTLIKNGYEIAYVPTLIIYHLIPTNRYSFDYLKRMAFESNRSWVKVLNMHGISPWKSIRPWTLFIRNVKAWLTLKAWVSELNYIKWKGATGKLKGQSEI